MGGMEWGWGGDGIGEGDGVEWEWSGVEMRRWSEVERRGSKRSVDTNMKTLLNKTDIKSI